MANREHLDLLRQGVNEWNLWRKEHPEVLPALQGATLIGVNLIGAGLIKAILRESELGGANLHVANLSGASLMGASLYLANLWLTTLSGADLSGAYLKQADLSEANLRDADLTEATLDRTILGAVDLRVVKGLETTIHRGPSTVGIDTILISQGRIPDIFLRNAGVPDSIIKAIPSNPLITIHALSATRVRIRFLPNGYMPIYEVKVYAVGLPLMT